MSNKIDSKEVELFLLDNLDFFETRESLVSELKFKHSDSSASSLLERQILKLRGEQKNLMDLLSSFIETASLNEDLFNKSKNLILSILDSSSREEVVETVQKDFKESFNVNNCILEFLNNEEIDALEKKQRSHFIKEQFIAGPFQNKKWIYCFLIQKLSPWLLLF